MIEDTEFGMVLMCKDCGVPVEVVIMSDLSVAYLCPECDEEVYLPDPETAGFH